MGTQSGLAHLFKLTSGGAVPDSLARVDALIAVFEVPSNFTGTVEHACVCELLS